MTFFHERWGLVSGIRHIRRTFRVWFRTTLAVRPSTKGSLQSDVPINRPTLVKLWLMNRRIPVLPDHLGDPRRQRKKHNLSSTNLRTCETCGVQLFSLGTLSPGES